MDENILTIVRQHLVIKDKEKKLFGEVFTPVELVCEMLEQLPKSVWTNPNLKWLDPANGIGNFPIVVYYKLMKGLKSVITDEAKRSKHIIEKMLYMVELNPVNCKVCKKIFKMIDPEATPNILKANFIEEFSITKNFSDGTRQFDIIMGNPPFQGTGRKKIYITFIDVILKKNLKTSGYLIFITPTLSLDFLLGIEITQKKLEKFYNIIYFNSSNKIKEDFFHNIGSDFSYFKIKNEAYKYKTQLILNNGDIEDNYKLEWNKKLNLQNIKYTKIIEKICNYENNLGIWVRKAARLTSNKDGSDLSTTESKQFKNKIVFKIHTTDEEYRWTDRTHMDFDKKKILYPTLGERILVDKKGHLFPGTSFTPYILCNNDLECDFLKKFIESNVMKFLKKINPNARSPLDEVLKRLKKNTKYKLPKKITDKDIYKYYKLSPKEITLIEAVGDG